MRTRYRPIVKIQWFRILIPANIIGTGTLDHCYCANIIGCGFQWVKEMSNRPLLNRSGSGTDGGQSSRRCNANTCTSSNNRYSSHSTSSKANPKRFGNCGRHKSHATCPATGKQCYKCSGFNHFRHMCRNKSVNELADDSDYPVNTRAHNSKQCRRKFFANSYVWA